VSPRDLRNPAHSNAGSQARDRSFARPGAPSAQPLRRHSGRHCPSPRVSSRASAPERPNGLLHRQLGDSARRDGALQSASRGHAPVAFQPPPRSWSRRDIGRLACRAYRAPTPAAAEYRGGTKGVLARAGFCILIEGPEAPVECRGAPASRPLRQRSLVCRVAADRALSYPRRIS
jgi:hypothetical protein